MLLAPRDVRRTARARVHLRGLVDRVADEKDLEAHGRRRRGRDQLPQELGALLDSSDGTLLLGVLRVAPAAGVVDAPRELEQALLVEGRVEPPQRADDVRDGMDSRQYSAALRRALDLQLGVLAAPAARASGGGEARDP